MDTISFDRRRSLAVGRGRAVAIRQQLRFASDLDEATRGLPLDLFVTFSSASSVLGAVGQADYATANMDNLRERGLLIVGTPDRVYQDLMEQYHEVGGFGTLLAMIRMGTMRAVLHTVLHLVFSMFRVSGFN